MARRRASDAREPASVRVTCAPLLRGRPQRELRMKPSRAPSTRRRTRGQHTSPDAAAAPAGETHTYEADQDGDLNLQLTMVSFADAKAKKGETYVVYAAADDGTVACVYQTPWRNG